MLDLHVCDGATLIKCWELCSIRTASLGTDHCMVEAVLQFECPSDIPTRSKTKLDLQLLQDDAVRAEFAV